MINKQIIGNRIVALRKKLRLSQNGLAQMLNVSYQAVSKWENGIALPDIDTLLELSELFGLSMEKLLAGDREDIKQQDILSGRLNTILEKDDLAEPNVKLLSAIMPYMTLEDTYALSDLLRKGQTKARFSLEFLSSDSGGETVQRDIPIDVLSSSVIDELAPALAEMAVEVLGGDDMVIKGITGIMRCPKCGGALQYIKHSREDEALVCSCGNRYEIMDGVIYFNTWEQSGNAWSNYYRTYRQYKEDMDKYMRLENGFDRHGTYYTEGRQLMIQHIKDQKPKYIMEIGTGKGCWMNTLIQSIDWPVCLILTDLSYRILKYARKYMLETNTNPNVKIVCMACDANTLPIDTNAIDCVTSDGGFENMERYVTGISESARVIKPGGSLIYDAMIVKDKQSPLVRRWIELMENCSRYDLRALISLVRDRADLEEILYSAGFISLEITKVDEEYEAPEVDDFPYDGQMLRWTGGAIIKAEK